MRPPEQEPDSNGAGQTLTEAIYTRIRNDILMGQLRPGGRLKLDHLRETYDASVNTLRETLSRLTSEGLVVNEGQKGFTVVSASLSDLRDITEMRLMLESQAIRLSLQKADLEWEARVVATYYKLSKIEDVVAEDPERYSKTLEAYNREFHNALISVCGSRWLLTFHGVMYDQSQRYRALAFQVRDFPRDQSRKEHKEIFEAALARDADRLIKTLSAHITKGAELYHEEDLEPVKAKRRGPQKKSAG